MLSTAPTLQKRASRACVRGTKTRVWGFCRGPATRTPIFGLQTTKPRLVAKVAATKTASGPSQWLSRDPIAERGGLNLYGYVGNDPIRRIDPLGLMYEDDPAWGDYQECLNGCLNVPVCGGQRRQCREDCMRKYAEAKESPRTKPWDMEAPTVPTPSPEDWGKAGVGGAILIILGGLAALAFG